MNRRQALITMMGAMGLATTEVFGASALLAKEPSKGASESSANRSTTLSDGQIRLLNEVGETILPETPESPGAKAINIGQFMNEIVRDFYTREEQQVFVQGLGQLQQRSNAEFSRDFVDLNMQERQQLLLALEKDADADYYQMMKQLTVWGYFSSQAGASKALRYAPIPGRYDGEVKIKPGTKAWANLLP